MWDLPRVDSSEGSRNEGREVVAPEFLVGIKQELEELRELLNPPAEGAEH